MSGMIFRINLNQAVHCPIGSCGRVMSELTKVVTEVIRSWDAIIYSGTTKMALGQNLVALVNIKIAGKWVFTPLTLMIIGFDTQPYG